MDGSLLPVYITGFFVESSQDNSMASFNRPVTIGVAGGTGSGKTTVSNQIMERVGQKNIAYLPHDAYYKDLSNLSDDERDRINFDHPDSLETELMIEHIKGLQQGKSVNIPVYDFTTDRRKVETLSVGPQPIVLVEGILIFTERQLRDLLDIKIYVDADADIRFIRRLRRDVDERARSVGSIIEQYLGTVRPMHLKFVEPSKRYADVIIPQGGFNLVAIDMVADRIRSMLVEQSEE
jgi:uridine kinase